MPFYYSPYIILPLLSAIVNALLAGFSWHRRHVPAATALFWLMFGMSGWSLSYALNTAATSLSIKIFCYQLSTTFVSIIPLALLVLALESVGLGPWLTRQRLLMVSSVFLICVLLVWTCDFHQLQRYAFHLYTSGPLLLLGFKQGPVFELQILYIRLLVLVATAILISGFWRSPRSEWLRFILLIAATGIPLWTWGKRLSPVAGFDIATSTFFLSGILYSIAIFRHRLLDLVPIARDTLFEMMIEPVIVIDKEGRLATANLAASRLFKLGKDSIGTSAAETLAPFPSMQRVVTNGMDSRDGFLLKEGPSNLSWHVTKARIEFSGTLHGWIIVLRDISTLRQTQEELSLSDERFRTLAENLADTIWQIDWEFQILYISNADYVMRGFAQEEVIGRPIFEIMNEEGAAEVRRINGERLKQEQQGIRTGSLRFEIQLKCKDDGLIWAEINSNPLRNGDGAIIGYIGSIRDITERKKLEEELLAEKHKLLKTLSISDSYQAQLLELNSRIKGMVEEEERSRLYRDLHDGAGQSLHAVCLHLKMLADGKGGYDDPKPLAAQLAKEVADVAAELRDIAHQLRPSYLNEITLDTAITRRCEMLSRRGVPIDIACEGDFTSIPPEVSDNFYRISQEAMANAARHANAERISIKLTRMDNILKLIIADDGCGIHEAHQANGMGLRIIHERATLIGATLDISSSQTGTTITVALEET